VAATFARRIGTALRPIRPGARGLASYRPGLVHAPGVIVVDSPAFGHGGDIPARFTADGLGLWPPLRWTGAPPDAESLVLLVEDADVPFFRPLTHAILHSIPPDATELPEGAIPRRMREPNADGSAAGRNGFGAAGWLPPSPVPGHGPHRYAFQLFALSGRPAFAWPPSRGRLLRVIAPMVIAKGALIGRCERV
jgi:Raf kinase inhibitor-like YbhB/YbcL family protein